MRPRLLFRNSRNVTLQGVPGGYPGAGLRAHGHSFWRVRNSRPQVRGYCLLKLDDCEAGQCTLLYTVCYI